MLLSEFAFDLPDELIARFPAEQRDQSRLLEIGQNHELIDRSFADIVDLISPNDCLILNNTKVIPARLLGQRESGGKVELLIERVEDNQHFLAQVKSSNALKPGTIVHVANEKFEAVERVNNFYRFVWHNTQASDLFDVLNHIGHIPLPPYIDRNDSDFDVVRYQTIFADQKGAVAAPTAGLHFSEAIFEALKEKGVEWDFVTLHVGSGTFSPIRVENVLEHKMHSERFTVPQSVVDLVHKTKARGGRVFAVGTTSVRSLESAAQQGELVASSGETDIYIYPGFEFKVVDSLITNFHLPESSLMLLVSAFAGKEPIFKAYRHAVEQQYRFFSYGDAMLLHRISSQA